MLALILCDSGAAHACAQEAKEHLKIIEEGTAHVLAEGTQAAIATYCWHAQTALDVLLLLARDVTLENLKMGDWSAEAKKILEEKTFAVHARGFTDDYDQNTPWGAAVKETTGLAVDLEKPGIIITPYQAEKKVLLGLSLTGKDLRKRDYRVFTSNTSLRPTIAATALRLAGYTGKEKLLIPYENDGTLAIEAAFIATKKSPFQYTGLALTKWWDSTPPSAKAATIDVVVPTVPFLKAVQKNAKIAGVHKNLTVTKAELDWLDTKYDEHAFDKVIAHLPCSGKRKKLVDAKKVSAELAYQLGYVLKKNGTCTIITLKPEEHAPAFTKYKELARTELHMGGQTIWVIRYGL